jgi:competence protein ComEA
MPRFEYLKCNLKTRCLIHLCSSLFKNLHPYSMKEYFSLTSLERNGLFALFILALGLLLFIKVRQVVYTPELVDLSALQDSVHHFYDSPLIKESQTTTYYSSDKAKNKDYETQKSTYVKKDKPLVMVEINSASAKELTQIKGVAEFYAKNIIKERKRLGGFSNKAQLLSLYGMTEEKLEAMKRQIRIDTSLCLSKVLLNSADSFQLAEVYIIDTYLASRIVRYRERLGGFFDSRQLLEIFCIDEELYHALMQRLVLDTVELRYLDINNDDFTIIMKHPYINGYKNTKAIFRYLDYGGVTTWKEFCAIPNLAIDSTVGLKHYVKFLPVEPKEELDTVLNK